MAAVGPWQTGGWGIGNAVRFLSRAAGDSADVLRIWREAKGHCWALPSSRTRTLLNMMVRAAPRRRKCAQFDLNLIKNVEHDFFLDFWIIVVRKFYDYYYFDFLYRGSEF